MKFLDKHNGDRRRRRPNRRTSISFTGDELVALGQLIAAGQVVLQTRHPAVPRLKAAMTRLRVAVPQGL